MHPAANPITWPRLYTLATLAAPGLIWAGIVATVAFRRIGVMFHYAKGLIATGAFATFVGCLGSGLMIHRGATLGVVVGLPILVVGLVLLVIEKLRGTASFHHRAQRHAFSSVDGRRT